MDFFTSMFVLSVFICLFVETLGLATKKVPKMRLKFSIEFFNRNGIRVSPCRNAWIWKQPSEKIIQ